MTWPIVRRMIAGAVLGGGSTVACGESARHLSIPWAVLVWALCFCLIALLTLWGSRR